MATTFNRADLKGRYDVPTIREDEWHSYSGSHTLAIVRRAVNTLDASPRRLLNAGAGCHPIDQTGWDEFSIDLFERPLAHANKAVCGNIHSLPFHENSFSCVICVGEVLAYCDPAAAIAEFARVLTSTGALICDFGSTNSIKYWLGTHSGRAADLVLDTYNGQPEKIWVYSPGYIRAILEANGFHIVHVYATHRWSALARRFGCASSTAVQIERVARWLPFPKRWADLMTFVAVQTKPSRG